VLWYFVSLGAALPSPAVVVGSDKLVGLAFWLGVIAALGALEVSAHLSSSAIASCEDMVARYLGHPMARLAAIGIWLYAGWHLFSH